LFDAILVLAVGRQQRRTDELFRGARLTANPEEPTTWLNSNLEKQKKQKIRFWKMTDSISDKWRKKENSIPFFFAFEKTERGMRRNLFPSIYRRML